MPYIASYNFKPLVSVIVPFTFERDLITECLQSIRGQSLQHLEIICVDNLADSETRRQAQYATERDPRFVVVKCKTRGAGPARNKGLQVARGKYVIFVDADDFLYDTDSLQSLYQAAETTNADLARGNVYVWWVNTSLYRALETLGQDIWFNRPTLTNYKEEPLLWLPVQHQAYLFNRELLVQGNLYYPNQLRGEDQPFLLNVLLSGPKVAVTNCPTYVYRKGYRDFDLLADPNNYIDRMISIQMIKSALLMRNLEVQWHLVYARTATYMERAFLESSKLSKTRAIPIIKDIIRGLEKFGHLDYRPFTIGSAGQRLLQHAMHQGWI